ncbi:glutaminase [Bradyrhizobium sp. USDA 4486]
MIFGLRRLSNSAGEVIATVGTAAGGAAPAGIGAALTGGAVRAGVVLPVGMDGGTPAARWRVRRSRAGRESSVHDRSPTGCRVGRESGHCLTGSDLMDTLSPPKHGHWPYISTGHLPEAETVQDLVREAHARFRSNNEGENPKVYPALERAPSDLFGVCIAGARGQIYAAGDTDYDFTIMSVSKPFVFAVCDLIGPEEARDKLGANATGLAFNSLGAVEQMPGARTNPMVNSGAIATTSLVPGASETAKWKFIHDGLSKFAGRTLPLNKEVYASASATNFRNRDLARLLQSYNRIYSDPKEATDLYTRQCSLNVPASTAKPGSQT